MPQADTAQRMQRFGRSLQAILCASLGIVTLLVYDASLGETDEGSDPDLAKAISYLKLAVRDRQCLAQVKHHTDTVSWDYSACMHENAGISYCKARQIDFEELAMMMATHKDMRRLLPIDRLVHHVTSRCVEIDGFIPPPLPLMTTEKPTECDTVMPVLRAYTAKMSLTGTLAERVEKGMWCSGNVGMSFLSNECFLGAKGQPFAGHEGFCRWPIKRPQNSIK